MNSAEENEVCRKIVSVINEFGISDKQRSMLLYLLSLELEDITKMQEVTSFLREIFFDVFLVQQFHHYTLMLLYNHHT